MADYYSHTWQSFRGSLVNVVFGHRAYEDLDRVLMKTKLVYSQDDPFLTRESLQLVDNLPDLDRVELAGQHRLPLEQARRIAFEILR